MARRRRRRRRARPQRTTTVERRKEGTQHRSQHRHGCGTQRSARPTRRRDDTAPPEDLRHYCRTSNSHPARAPPSARPRAVTRGRLHVPITVALRAHSRRSRLARGLGPIDPGEERTKHRRPTHPIREFLQRDVYRQLLALKLDHDVAEVHVGVLSDARALRHLMIGGDAPTRAQRVGLSCCCARRPHAAPPGGQRFSPARRAAAGPPRSIRAHARVRDRPAASGLLPGLPRAPRPTFCVPAHMTPLRARRTAYCGTARRITLRPSLDGSSPRPERQQEPSSARAPSNAYNGQWQARVARGDDGCARTNRAVAIRNDRKVIFWNLFTCAIRGVRLLELVHLRGAHAHTSHRR